MKKMGIDVTFVDQNLPEEELAKAFRPNTRAMFGEIITNPTVSVLDIEKFARLAHSHGVPLIVDNTFATPVNCQPIKWGADIVTHSTTKYMDGHGVSVGGAIVDSGNFDWLKYADNIRDLQLPMIHITALSMSKNSASSATLQRLLLSLCVTSVQSSHRRMLFML